MVKLTAKVGKRIRKGVKMISQDKHMTAADNTRRREAHLFSKHLDPTILFQIFHFKRNLSTLLFSR